MDAVEIFYPPPAPLKNNQKCSTMTYLQKSGEVIYKFAKFLMFILSGFSSPSSSAKGRTSNPDRRRRWSSLAKPALGVALAMGVLTAGQAQAFVVTVGGQDWDVTTFTGSYIVNTSKFGLPPAPAVMPWWGSASLAQQFVAATGGNLGSPPPKLRDSLHPSSDLNKTLTILMLPGPTLVFRAAPFLSMLTL